MSNKTVINVLRFDLSPDTRRQIQNAVDPLFKGERHATRVDVTIEGEYGDNTRILYNITLRAQLRAEIISELKQGEKVLPAVQAAVAAMQQRLRETASATSA